MVITYSKSMPTFPVFINNWDHNTEMWADKIDQVIPIGAKQARTQDLD